MSFLELFCNGDGRKTIDYNLRIIGFTVVVGLLLSIIYARPACAQTIAVSPTTGDFGNVSVGGDSSVQIFTISHDDDDDLDLTDIALSDDTDYSLDLDAGANPCDSTSPTIAVDGNCTVGVTFSPESTGVLNVTLDISSDDADNSPFRVDLTGTGISSKIAVDPAGFEYGDILVGSSSASQNFVITNIGKGDLKVTGITLSDTSNYSLNLNAGGASSCGSTTPKIKEDENCTVGVTFNPTELGVIDGLLTVTSDDKDDNQFDVVLTGRGGTDGDTDGDGMSDGWELRIIEADPTDGINTIEDVLPNEDFDADGVSNLNEFIDGSNPVNARPDAAVLLSPGDGMTEVVLTPQLQTEAMNDPKEGDVHIRTRWQISTDQDFEDDDKLVLDIISDTHLTSIVVPDLVLFLDTVYFWRAAFSDSAGQISAWPDEPFSFTTVDVDESDSNLNGIPDDQEAACSELFGEEEMPANSMCVNSATGGGQIGLEGSTNVTSIVACRSVDPADVTEELSGFELELGLMSFKAACDNVGDTIEVIYHLSETIPANSRLYKWHPIDGWREYANAEFLPDGKSVLIRITDGGDGDLDGVANGVVIDPSGIATPAAVGGASSTSGGDGGNYDFTCFIESARFISQMKIEWLALILLMGCGIFVLQKIRKKSLKL